MNFNFCSSENLKSNFTEISLETFDNVYLCDIAVFVGENFLTKNTFTDYNSIVNLAKQSIHNNINDKTIKFGAIELKNDAKYFYNNKELTEPEKSRLSFYNHLDQSLVQTISIAPNDLDSLNKMIDYAIKKIIKPAALKEGQDFSFNFLETEIISK